MKIPGPSDHHAIVGRNGSGKTVSAAFFLSHRDFDRRPWNIFNSKNDDLLNRIPGAVEMKMGDALPKKPGLYMWRPIAERDDEIQEAMLWEIFNKGRSGLYVDEVYNLPNQSTALRNILTQGRSKKISGMFLIQRPAWVSRFLWSESNYIQCFDLSMDDDVKVMEKLLRVNAETLPRYHSYYYDVKEKKKVILGPCEDEKEILKTFDERRIDRRPVTFL